MRITGGVWAGRRIQLPKGPRIRPTQDQVRQALFNLLAGAVKGARVLDLFCGSGALGLEALSRGAAHATFVDRSGFGVEAIRKNLRNLRSDPCWEIVRADALKAIPKLASGGAQYDLIFLDPPYGGSAARKTLIALAHCAILADEGWVIAEHSRRDSLPREIAADPAGLIAQGVESYGDTALTLYRRQ